VVLYPSQLLGIITFLILLQFWIMNKFTQSRNVHFSCSMKQMCNGSRSEYKMKTTLFIFATYFSTKPPFSTSPLLPKYIHILYCFVLAYCIIDIYIYIVYHLWVSTSILKFCCFLICYIISAQSITFKSVYYVSKAIHSQPRIRFYDHVRVYISTTV